MGEGAVDDTFGCVVVTHPMQDLSTPLHLAIKEGKVDIVKMLLEAGASTNSTNEVSPDSTHPTHRARPHDNSTSVY